MFKLKKELEILECKFKKKYKDSDYYKPIETLEINANLNISNYRMIANRKHILFTSLVTFDSNGDKEYIRTHSWVKIKENKVKEFLSIFNRNDFKRNRKVNVNIIADIYKYMSCDGYSIGIKNIKEISFGNKTERLPRKRSS
jgi:hypothetical protein